MDKSNKEIIKKINPILKDYLFQNICIRPTKKTICFYDNKNNKSYALSHENSVKFLQWIKCTNDIDSSKIITELLRYGIPKKIFNICENKEFIIEKINPILKDCLSQNICIKPSKKTIYFYDNKNNKSYTLSRENFVKFSQWIECTSNIDSSKIITELLRYSIPKKIFNICENKEVIINKTIKKKEPILRDYLLQNISIKPTKESICFYDNVDEKTYSLAYENLIELWKWLKCTKNIKVSNLLIELIKYDMPSSIFKYLKPCYIRNEKDLYEIEEKFEDNFSKIFGIDYKDFKIKIGILKSYDYYPTYKEEIISKNNLYSKVFKNDLNIKSVYKDDIIAEDMFFKCIRKLNDDDSDYYYTYFFIPLEINQNIIDKIRHTYFFIKNNRDSLSYLDDFYFFIISYNERYDRTIKELNELNEPICKMFFPIRTEQCKIKFKFELNENISFIFPHKVIKLNLKDLKCAYDSIYKKIERYDYKLLKNSSKIIGYSEMLYNFKEIIMDKENLEIFILISELKNKEINIYSDILIGNITEKEYQELQSYATLKYLKKEKVEYRINYLIFENLLIEENLQLKMNKDVSNLLTPKILNLLKKEGQQNFINNISNWKSFYETIEKGLDLELINFIKLVAPLPPIDIRNVMDTINFLKNKSTLNIQIEESLLDFIISKIDKSVIPILTLNYNILNLENNTNKELLNILIDKVDKKSL